jgi:hypothetical protein
MSHLSLLLAVLATWFGKDVPTRTGNAYHLQPYQAKLKAKFKVVLEDIV